MDSIGRCDPHASINQTDPFAVHLQAVLAQDPVQLTLHEPAELSPNNVDQTQIVPTQIVPTSVLRWKAIHRDPFLSPALMPSFATLPLAKNHELFDGKQYGYL